METAQLLEHIKAISTPEDMERVSEMIYQTLPGKMSEEISLALLNKLREVTKESKAARREVIAVLQLHGIDYPLTDWLTPKNYALKFGIKNTETVINWINRGVIPADCVKEIVELDLRLVRAKEYSPRKYSSSATQAH